MKHEIVWSPLSVEKIQEITDFIIQDNPAAADEWVLSLYDSIESLSTFPESGRYVPELSDMKMRELIFGNFRIIYSVNQTLCEF